MHSNRVGDKPPPYTSTASRLWDQDRIRLVSIPMMLTAALPTYARIGIAAPLLLSAGRLAMGFSVGGEWSGTMVALLENADDRNRHFTMSLGSGSVTCAW